MGTDEMVVCWLCGGAGVETEHPPNSVGPIERSCPVCDGYGKIHKSKLPAGEKPMEPPWDWARRMRERWEKK